MSTAPALASIPIATKTIQKLRLRILPYVLLLFVVALIDRNNVSFAALTMNQELGITSQQFGLMFGIFYFGYFIFEIPSNLLLHRSRRAFLTPEQAVAATNLLTGEFRREYRTFELSDVYSRRSSGSRFRCHHIFCFAELDHWSGISF